MDKKLEKYKKDKMFEVVDFIGVPHPYVIGTKHVVHASDKFGGRLGEDAIRDGENHGIKCCATGCQMKFDEHKFALLVWCGVDITVAKGKNLLQKYLLSIKEMTEKDGYVGFAFTSERPKT